jgi:hypothetical protein
MGASVPTHGPFDTWYVDYKGPLPVSSGGSVFIIVAIDAFTRWVELRAVKAQNAAAVAAFLTDLFQWAGLPRNVVTDCGTHFMKEVDALCAALQINHHVSPPYRHETVGIVERVMKELNDTIKAILRHRTADWDQIVPAVQAAINTARNRSIGVSPFEALFGFPCRTSLVATAGANPQLTSVAGDLSQHTALIHTVRAYVSLGSNMRMLWQRLRTTPSTHPLSSTWTTAC